MSTQTCMPALTFIRLKLVPVNQSSPSCAKLALSILQRGLGCFSLEGVQRKGTCEENYSKNTRII